MSDNEKTTGAGKANAGWTDKERIIYLVGLLDHAGTKPDFKNAPLPNGRSELACERMVGRLKVMYKAELEALKVGEPFDGEATPKKRGKPKANVGDVDGTPKSTPKRKGKTAATDDDNGSPKKKGKAATASSAAAAAKAKLAYMSASNPSETKSESQGNGEADEV